MEYLRQGHERKFRIVRKSFLPYYHEIEFVDTPGKTYLTMIHEEDKKWIVKTKKK